MNNIPVFVINLKKDKERKGHMKSLCQQYSLNYQFIDAVYGKELNDRELIKVYNRKQALSKMDRELTVTEIGVALSNIKIYQKIVNENIEKAIIFEDDITFDNRIHDALHSIDKFPDDWECVLLHYHRHDPFIKYYCINFHDRLTVGKELKIVRFIDVMHSAGAYIINLAGARKLLATLEKGIYKPIDLYTGDENHINLYGLYPRIVESNQSLHLQSSIGSERYISERSDRSVNIRRMLKKIKLYDLVKKIFIKKDQIIYYLKNFKKCITKPKKY